MSNLKHGRYDKPLVAIGLCITSMTLFSLQDAFVKWLSSDYWLIQLLFIRSLIVASGSGLFILKQHGVNGFSTSKPGSHVIRTTFNFFAFVSYYLAVTQLPLANATSIALTSPLFMTALSGPLLGEPVGIKRYAVLLFGFIGVLIVVQPTAENLNAEGSLLAITGALLFALLAIQTRKMGKTESSELMVFYASLAFLIVTGTLMIFYWEEPDIESLGLMCLLGVITLFAQYTITQAFQYGEVRVVAPFEYITVFWAVMIGWYVFAEPPTLSMLSGATLIIVAGLCIVWIEHRDSSRKTVIDTRM